MLQGNEGNIMEDGNIHKGHRQKVKQRFLANGLAGESPHHVLELLLFYAIPHRDTNPVAHALIDRFGSLSGVLRADVAELKTVPGIGENAATLLHLILPIYEAYVDDLLRTCPVVESVQELVDYMRPKFIGATVEKVYLICIGENRRLLAARKLNEGDICSCGVDFRVLASIVLETKAQNVVLMHNHPNGIALPSSDDIALTTQTSSFLRSLNVHLLNHIIVSEEHACSMADMARFAHLFYGTTLQE